MYGHEQGGHRRENKRTVVASLMISTRVETCIWLELNIRLFELNIPVVFNWISFTSQTKHYSKNNPDWKKKIDGNVILPFRYRLFRCALLVIFDHYPTVCIFIYYRYKSILEALKRTYTTVQGIIQPAVKSSPSNSSDKAELKWMCWRHLHHQGWPW